jgi:hypothetical protein
MLQRKGFGSKLSPNSASSISAISNEKIHVVCVILLWKNISVTKCCAILHVLFTIVVEEVVVYTYTVKSYHLPLFFKLTLHHLILYKYSPTNYVKKPAASHGVIN